MKSICVVGLGYIGLPTASLFANSGFQVLGVDTNRDVVEAINSGRNHIEEVGLRTLVEAAVGSGHLKAASQPSSADAFILAVPTPFDSHKCPDLAYVFASTRSILPYLQKGNLIVLESTVPPGTTKKVAALIAEERPELTGKRAGQVASLEVLVAHCPERVLPGRILKELVENDRVVGGVTQEASACAADLYAAIVSGKIYQTNATTAEMVKLSENTFRDVNIALANELSVVCEKLGIDVWEVIRLANNHPRVKILNPGPGVGGHCIAVDPWFIVSEFPEDTQVIRAARMRNDGMPEIVTNRVSKILAGLVRPKIACLGASYKGNVGDARNSPAVEVYRSLVSRFGRDAEVVINDMHVDGNQIPLQPLESVLRDASLIVVLSDHNEYKALNPAEVAKLVKERKVFDTRNLIDRRQWESAGFEVCLLGTG
jgi:UDP-N-acetyl-D-mannosaminuronic acid dehydrogenase